MTDTAYSYQQGRVHGAKRGREEAAQELYAKAVTFVHQTNQVVGENQDFYITLEQLEAIFKDFLSKEAEMGGKE